MRAPKKKPDFEIDLTVGDTTRRLSKEDLSISPDDGRTLYFHDPSTMCVEEYLVDGSEVFVITEVGRHRVGSVVNQHGTVRKA